jgi:hypothetical protein
MRSHWLRTGTRVTGLVLVGLGTAHLVGNQGEISLQPIDPLLQVSSRYVFWGAGICELCVGLVCLLAGDLLLANGLVLWLTTCLVGYRLGLLHLGVATLRGYYQTMAQELGVGADVLNVAFGAAAGSLWCGSALGVVLLWKADRRKADPGHLRMTCPACGVHIEFATANLGQKVGCPRCQAAVTLRTPEPLKMTCFFCKKHIEFPPHAIGQKIHCPHCKMDITLKEPA